MYYSVWLQINSTFGSILSIFGDDKVGPALRKFGLKLVSNAIEKIGWESAGESYLQSNLRPLLISTAARCDHEA